MTVMNNRQELAALVTGAQAGELAAFDALVRRFQDMAVGYAYSLLGDRARPRMPPRKRLCSCMWSCPVCARRRPFSPGFDR
jgi:hypothetical protein